jgi:hypothetical protein
MEQGATRMTKTLRIEYTEYEAATLLGVSVDQLRSLVKNHIVKDEGEPTLPAYQSTDLVVLRILAGLACQVQATRM